MDYCACGVVAAGRCATCREPLCPWHLTRVAAEALAARDLVLGMARFARPSAVPRLEGYDGPVLCQTCARTATDAALDRARDVIGTDLAGSTELAAARLLATDQWGRTFQRGEEITLGHALLQDAPDSGWVHRYPFPTAHALWLHLAATHGWAPDRLPAGEERARAHWWSQPQPRTHTVAGWSFTWTSRSGDGETACALHLSPTGSWCARETYDLGVVSRHSTPAAARELREQFTAGTLHHGTTGPDEAAALGRAILERIT